MGQQRRRVVFTPLSERQLRRLPLYAQRAIVDGIRIHLIGNDPHETTRNKFQLRRPSNPADYELRVQNWRVFYRLEESADLTKIKVTLVGEKQGDRLIIDRKEFQL